MHGNTWAGATMVLARFSGRPSLKRFYCYACFAFMALMTALMVYLTGVFILLHDRPMAVFAIVFAVWNAYNARDAFRCGRQA